MRTVLDLFFAMFGFLMLLIHCFFFVVPSSALKMAFVFCISIACSADLLLCRWLGRVLYMGHLLSCMTGRVSQPNLVAVSLVRCAVLYLEFFFWTCILLKARVRLVVFRLVTFLAPLSQ